MVAKFSKSRKSFLGMPLTKASNVFFYFSNYHLTDLDKSLLIKGLDFAIPPKKTEYSKFLLLFVLLFRDIKSNSESSVDLASV